jgi:hypothetical protein
MDVFKPCDCEQSGIWTCGLRPRGRSNFACINCNGSVKIRDLDGIRLIDKTNAEYCLCGIPWLQQGSNECARCTFSIEPERLGILKSNYGVEDKQVESIEVAEDSSSADSNHSPKEWVELVWAGLFVLGSFGFFYNVFQSRTSENLSVHVIDTALLAYTNFLAYPLLIFATITGSSRFKLLDPDLRSFSWTIFLVAPFVLVILQLVWRIFERLW